jgi:dUTP pyrophosphatase
MKIKIKKTRNDAIIPTRPDNGSAGYDLYSLSSSAIIPHSTIRFNIGLAFEIPQGYAGIIYDRSSMGSHGYNKHGGLIDSSYRGTVEVCLCNTTDETKYINVGDRIAQITFQKVENVDFEEVEELSDSERAEKGFGASGV